MKISFILFPLVILLALCSCGKSEPQLPSPSLFFSGSTTIDINGVSRDFLYRIPKKNSYPLLIVLHGGGGSPEQIEYYSHFTSLAQEKNDFGVIYPQGNNKHWNDGRAEAGSNSDDIGFIRQIITTYKTTGASSIYVVGMSNGGVMAQRVACELSSEIDGIAIVAATKSVYLEGNCLDNTTPLPALFIFGDDDRAFLDNLDIVNPVFPSQKRGKHIGITKTLEQWEIRNSCSQALTQRQSIDSVSDDTVINISQAQGCAKDLKYYEVVGGGHRWPEKSADNNLIITSISGVASQEIESAQEIITFFGL